jgi:hypothetical protein
MMAVSTSTGESPLNARSPLTIVDDGAEGELVGAKVRRGAAALLGRHVADGAEHEAGVVDKSGVVTRRSASDPAAGAWRGRSPAASRSRRA